MDYSTLRSEKIFEGKVFNVRIDDVKLPSGRKMRVDVVEHGGAVVILPLDENSRIWFVDQYRHPAEERVLELPAGTLKPGEDPKDCAIRECREEIGMSPRRLTHLGGFYLAPGYSTEYSELFLAQDLSPSPLPHDADEDLTTECLTLGEVERRIKGAEFHDAKTLAGLLMLYSHLGIKLTS
ncbi:MAG: NUDIX domain-containing protein [Anaerolineales bacterium]|nr:NUDIX domain-containing protein [Anaerolineales bacterium]